MNDPFPDYVSSFLLQSVLGFAVALAALVLWLGFRGRTQLLWLAHWVALAVAQVGGLYAARELGAARSGGVALVSWSTAVGGFYLSSALLILAARALTGERRAPGWSRPLWISCLVAGGVVGAASVLLATPATRDFIASGGVVVRLGNVAGAVIAFITLRRSAMWRQDLGMRVLGLALIAVVARALLGMTFSYLPGGVVTEWLAGSLVNMQVIVQVWFGIGTTLAIVSGQRMELMAAERRMNELERELMHADRRETVGQMAAGVAHDFRNVLAAIRAAGEMALDEVGPDSSARPDLLEIIHAADRGSALAARLLAHARGGASASVVFDANDRVRQLHPMIDHLLPRRITRSTTFSPESVLVHVDPVQFDQVLLNLVVNARDAIAERGAIGIETSVAATMPPPPRADDLPSGVGPFFRVRVTDTGAGIPAHVLPRVFDPFFTTRPEHGGTGLGLSTSLSIVRRFGGTVDVVSAPGLGTHVDVYLPLADGSAPLP